VTPTDAFLAEAGAAPEAFGDRPALEETIARLIDAGRGAWPALALAAEDFACHLGRCLAADAPPEPAAALAATAAADLYLACACGRGDAAALAELDRRYIDPLPPQLASRSDPEGFLDEVKQVLRVRLLVAEPGAEPRIARYTGRGPLGAWVRISAGRVALNLREARATTSAKPREALDLHGAVPDAELTFLRGRHGAEFRAALEATLAAVTPRDGTLLRLYYIEGVGAEAMATMYGVDRRTVLRWIARIREEILVGVRCILTERLALSASGTELASLMDLLHRDIGASILLLLEPKEK
jgi:RNA polymerase sigma-70 factor (ECF subfamily)